MFQHFTNKKTQNEDKMCKAKQMSWFGSQWFTLNCMGQNDEYNLS